MKWGLGGGGGEKRGGKKKGKREVKKGIQGENSLREEKEGNGTKEKERRRKQEKGNVRRDVGMEEWRKRRKGEIEKKMQKWKGGGRKGGRENL